jgi:thiosulfate/3-mercaptopyruvate sulfurtransferase
MESPIFISTEELQSLLSSNSVQVIDAGINHKESFVTGHIPSSIFFNIAEIKSNSSLLIQEIPTLEEFTEYMTALGVKSTALTVVYDQTGFALSGRAWYLLTHFGVANVRILDGGLPKWCSEGRQIESGESSLSSLGENINDYKFYPGLNDRLSFEMVLQLTNQIKSLEINAKIWDPRPFKIYNEGTVDTAVNLPVAELFNENKTVKSREEVIEIIRNRIGDGKIVTSCFKGNNASLAYMLLSYAGHLDRWIFTGSYEEWKLMRVQ